HFVTLPSCNEMTWACQFVTARLVTKSPALIGIDLIEPVGSRRTRFSGPVAPPLTPDRRFPRTSLDCPSLPCQWLSPRHGGEGAEAMNRGAASTQVALLERQP